MASGLEETLVFQPRFDGNGLIPAIVTDARDGTVLMFAFMNAEALRLSRETGLAHFWSRSRQALWKKGERHWFFVVIGLDQAIHMTCLFATYEVLA